MTSGVMPRSRLVEFARPVRREVAIDPLGAYRTIGCHLYGKGVYERETKGGAEIKARRMFAVERDDLVINRIWAQKGSAGIVPESLAGAVVTQDFPVWRLIPHRALTLYIGWYLKTSGFWEECRRHSHGTSGRERLSPKELPHVEFPLPSLDEQRRIVARIEELAALIEEARALRCKARGEARGLLEAAVSEVFSRARGLGWHSTELGEMVAQTQTRSPTKCPDRQFVYVDISSVDKHRGVIREPRKYLGAEAPSRARRVIQTGDLIFAMTRPYLKAIALVPDELDNQICSTGFCVLRAQRNRVDPRWLLHICRSDHVVDYVTKRMRGSNYPAVSDKDVKSAEIPLPPVEDQRRIVAYLDGLQAQVDELTALQDATQTELDALLPSVLDRAFRGEL